MKPAYRLRCGCLVDRKTEHLISQCDACKQISDTRHGISEAERLAARQRFAPVIAFNSSNEIAFGGKDPV